MAEQKILLSVLITTYNLENVITQTLDSIILQKMPFPYEVLIGDDGSTDHTVEKIRKHIIFKEGVLHIYERSHDQNDNIPAIVRASHNRIDLAKRAMGKYIVFLDGDDFFTNLDSLRNKVAVLERPENKDCVMCGSNFCFLNERTGETLPAIRYQIIRNKFDGRIYWKSGLWLHAETFVIRNIIDFEHIENEWINENLFDDNLIVFAYLKHGNIYYINSTDLNYRQNTQGFLNSSAEKQLFVNSLVYAHSKYFLDRKRQTNLDSDLRCFGVISDLYKRKIEIPKKLISTIPAYGFSVIELSKLIAFWTGETKDRKDKYRKIRNLVIWGRIYYSLYYYGFKQICNKALEKIKSAE